METSWEYQKQKTLKGKAFSTRSQQSPGALKRLRAIFERRNHNMKVASKIEMKLLYLISILHSRGFPAFDIYN